MSKNSKHTSWPIRVRDSGPRLTKAAIERAQMKLGVTFPEDYRQFMFAHNGGKPEPNSFVFRRKGKQQVDWVQAFSPITNSRIDSLNLFGQQDLLRRFAAEGVPVPDGSIAIGYNGPGDSILLFSKGRRKGQVWLKVWDDTVSDPNVTASPEEGLYKLAGSFRAFLKMLCTEEEARQRAE